MKKVSLLILLIGLGLFAQETQPKLEFSSTEFNFGTVEKGEKVSYEYEFTNSGNAELEIKDVKPTCGCTTAKPEKLNYDKGETGKIAVTFDSTRFAGAITKTIVVVSNDPDTPRMQLKLTGKILQEVDANPVSLAIPNVKRSDIIEREITLSTGMLDKLEISEVKSNLDFLKLETVRVDDKTYKIKVSFDGKDTPEDRFVFQGNITYKTNGTKVTEGKSSVFIRMARPVQVRPGSVYFFSTKEGQARDMVVKLEPTISDSLEVTEIKSDLEFVKAELVEGEGPVQVKISLSPKATKGDFRGFVTLTTNLKEQPTVKIPVRGSVI